MSNREKSVKPSASLERKLAAYAAASGAVFAASEAAHAAIIYSGPQNVSVGVGGSFGLNLNGDTFTDYTFQQVANSPTSSSLQIASNTDKAVATSAIPGQPLDAGVSVENQTFAPSSTTTSLATIDSTSNPAGSGPFYNISNKYLGFQLGYGGGTDYGWAQLSVSGGTDPATGPTATIIDWAYEDTGSDILTGATPEPASLALLAMGAAGVAMYRPQRRGRSGQA